MGTPSSTPAHTQSNLDLVLRGPSVPAAALTPAEWLEIIRHETEIVRPYLKYMSNWRTLRDVLERPWDDAPRWRLEDPTVSSGIRADLGDHCRFVTSRRFSAPYSQLAERKPEQYVLLRRDGTWLQVDATSRHLTYYGVNYVLEDVVVTELGDAELIELLEYDRQHYGTRLGYQLVLQLEVMVRMSVHASQKRLDRLREIEARTGLTTRRVARTDS